MLWEQDIILLREQKQQKLLHGLNQPPYDQGHF